MKQEAAKVDLNKRRAAMLRDRSDWEPRWKRIQENVAPIFGYFPDKNYSGKRKWSSLYNDTPLYSVQVLSAGLQSGLTSPNQQWYHLADPDPRVNENRDVRKYCIECEEIMSADMLKNGVYDAFAKTYNNLGPYGTGGFLLLPDPAQTFISVPLETGEYCIAQDYKCKVNEFFREISMTPAQLMEQFGEKVLPAVVAAAFKNGDNSLFKVFHLITPNDGRIEGSRGLAGYEWLSFYWMDEAERPLAVGGHSYFPFIGGRWHQVGSDVYGYGPGEVVLANSMQLQAMEKDKIAARQLTVQPPMQIPTTVPRDFQLLPGRNVYYEPTSNGAPIQPLLNVNFDLNGVMQDILVFEERIKRAFYTQLFMAILDRSTENPQKTATEIQEMIAEKSSMIGPVLQRLDREILRPCINSIYAIENMAGRLPEPPEILIGRELNIEYTSPLMMALNTRKTASVERFVGFLGNVAQASPEVMDIVDVDKTARIYGNYIDVPPECMRSAEEIEMIRQNRAEAARMQEQLQQQQQMMEAAKVLPDAAVKMNDAEVNPNSLLGNVASLIGGGA